MIAWRLVIAARPASGFWNMAVDEALLASASSGGVPTLRLYRWDGPWLSLGHAQRFADDALAACRDAGVAVVRRVTGGRAVLHGADLTYAVTAPAHALPDGLDASYRVVSDALLEALRSLGIEAERVAGGPVAVAPGAFDCFAEAANDEVCASGRKLAGSAQRRTGGALLQHGSIRLAPDPPRAAAIAGTGLGATSLAELGVAPAAARPALAEAIPKALARRLGVAIEPARLAPSEANDARRRAAALRRDPLARRAGPSSRAF